MELLNLKIGDIVDCPLQDDISVMFVREINTERHEVLLADAPEGGHTTWTSMMDVAGVSLTPRILHLAGFKGVAGKRGLFVAKNGIRLRRLGPGYYIDDIYDELCEPLMMEDLHQLQHYHAAMTGKPLLINGIHRPIPLSDLFSEETSGEYYWYSYQLSDGRITENVTAYHPLETINSIRLLEDSGAILLNWKEISYDQFQNYDEPWKIS
ncbi:hypothetical protein [Chitinophaga qingshengii]|uniref:Uncharacterized protein n=1 Tax=Chitinophaga qingshengii TaxID=1569794 RepID=A0ABR7TQ46_9BACT|nr:hypothetical protein [Chitinophaga qingshengii]MBC9931765.1 hypothetical protein [Chitinophaga qingshengii]